MLSSSTLLSSLLHCILLLLTNADNGQPIRGVPGIDYPNYQSIPHTSFRCSEQELIPGLYADPETGCQMFHHCYEHRHESFLCPPGTIFNQAILACDYWYSADCSAATPYHKIKSQNKASTIDPKFESAPIKNPSINVFSKLASLYDIQEPSSIGDTNEEDTYNYASEDYQGHDNNILSASNIHDRREGVITGTYKDTGYSQYENKNGNQLRIIDDFESSGEPDDSDEQVSSEEELSSLTDTEKPIDFEKQYFEYDEIEDFEHDSDHQLNNEEQFSNTQIENKSSIHHKSEDAFVKRQSKAIENHNIRKQRRPLYTIIEHEAGIKEFTTTEMSKQNMDLILNDPTNSPSYFQESVSTSNHVSTLSASKTKSRKPVLIQLEDSYQYNINNEKISSVKYGNSQSNIPEFSMDAEEISVKLFPSNTKRKLVNKLMQHQFIENNNAELKHVNNIINPESNIYGTSTLSTLYDIDSFLDISINQKYPKRKKNAIRIFDFEDNHNIYMENKELPETTTFTPASNIYGTSTLSIISDIDSFQDILINQKYPKRNKNAIRIIDSEDNYEVYMENKELMETTTFTPALEEDFTTQSTSTNSEVYDKYAETQFDAQDVEMADGNSEFVRQLEDNHNVRNEEFEDATTPIDEESTEDEYTTQYVVMNSKNLDEFAKIHFHDYDLENSRDTDNGRSDVVKQTEDDHEFDIENEEISDATTLASTIEDEFTTQSSNTNFEDLDKIFYPTFDDQQDIKIDHEIKIDHDNENGYSDLVSKNNGDSYSDFIAPYPHIEMSDESEDAHFNQMNPDAISDLQENENKEYLEYIRHFPKHESFEDYKVSNDKEDEDYSFITTEFSFPETSSNIPHSEEDGNRFYSNHNTAIEPISDDPDTYESFSHQVSKILAVNKDITNASQPLSNETDIKEQYFQHEEIKGNNMNSEMKQLRENTSQNILLVESSHARADAEVDTLINAENNEYLMDENAEDKLKVDLFNNKSSQNSSNKNILREHYDSFNILSDIDSKGTEDFSQRENESNIETILHKLELNQPTDPGVLGKMELKSIEDIDDKIKGTPNFEDSEIDSEDLTKILDDLENYQNVAENDPISLQEHVFNPNPKPDSDSKAKLEVSSKITLDKTLSNIETSAVTKVFSKLPQNNPGNIMKDKPIRIPRMSMPGYNRDFNFEKFSRDFNLDKLISQNFAGVPYSMIHFKQKSMKKLLGSSMDGYGMKGVEHFYSTRTGDFLESPKISKLISIGKNLLKAKKAKLRILRRYVNY